MKKTVFVLLSMIIVALSIPLLPFFLFVFMNSQGNEIAIPTNPITPPIKISAIPSDKTIPIRGITRILRKTEYLGIV